MQKVRWELTNNFKVGKDFTEYDKFTYECPADDVWVTIETPQLAGPTKLSPKES